MISKGRRGDRVDGRFREKLRELQFDHQSREGKENSFKDAS
jgi:hypothetical protein